MPKREYYIGIMSGTSLDGVDVVLCGIDATSCSLEASLEYPMPQSIKETILQQIEAPCSLESVGVLDVRLGRLFAKAVNALLAQTNLKSSDIKAIGSHGQTLWHNPAKGITIQLGDANIIAVDTGIAVVADFRRKDVALGGQGAPFAPAFHNFIFDNIKEVASVVNIGGMANITVLGEPLIGYDTGCGNVLLDMWIAKHQGVAYDKEGAWAKSGRVDYTLLDAMMSEGYFALDYPKSTGREKFNESWLEGYLEQIKGNESQPEDVQRTLLELTALSISNEVLKFNRDLLVLCGGGAKNSFLVERLKCLMPNIEIVLASDANSLEAMAFAWLAYKRIHQEPVNLKEVTGAKANAILGGVYV